MRERARAKRKLFMEVFDEIEEYSYGKDYDKLLYSGDVSAAAITYKAKINRASEFAEIMGTYIFPQVPDAQVNSRPWATYWAKKRHKVERDYLNYALWFGDYHLHARKEATEALLSGRGVVYTGYNGTKKIVQNVYRPVRAVLMDPDASATEDLNWVAILRRKPKWELKDHLRQVRGDNAMDGVIDGLQTMPDADDKNAPPKDSSTDVCDYYEFYLKVGLWRFGQTQLGTMDPPPEGQDGTTEQDDSPKKIYWVPGQILAIADWEMPLYMIDEWPISWSDMRPRPNHLWPAAPIEPGLTHLRNLNFMYTFYANRIRFAWRTFLISVNYNGVGVDDNELMKLVFEGDFSFLRVNVKGNEHKFNDLVQQFKMDAGIDEFERAWALCSNEFAKSTGLSEIMYAGEGGRQSRIKADVEFKAKQAQNRVEDMRRLFMDHMSLVMRKTLFAARFLHTPEDISTLLGAEAGGIWGTLASPDQVKQEAQMRSLQKQQILLQAQLQLKQYQIAIKAAPPPSQGGPVQFPPPPPMPTDDQMEEQLGPPKLVSMDEWIYEAERTVDAGSVKPMDHDAKMDNLHALLTQVMPAAMQLPGAPKMIATLLNEFVELNQFDDDVVQAAKTMVQMCSQVPGMPNAAPSPPANQNPNGRPPGVPQR